MDIYYTKYCGPEIAAGEKNEKLLYCTVYTTIQCTCIQHPSAASPWSLESPEYSSYDRSDIPSLLFLLQRQSQDI